MKEMTYDELRIVQLDILQYIHDFCIKNDIKYSLAYGTLLGAVRHGGYIPWDDDIDIAMLRPDYERFIHEFQGVSDIYNVAEARIDKEVNNGFAKVYDNRTLIIEQGNTKNLGIFVDVFPIDDMLDSYEDSLRYFKSYRKTRFLQKVKGRDLRSVKSLWKKPIIAILKSIFYGINIHDKIIDAINKAIKNSKSGSVYVSLLTDADPLSGEIMKREIWSEFCPISFEGRMFMALKNTDDYLKHMYGNYMQLPPKEQQVPKHDFDKIYWI